MTSSQPMPLVIGLSPCPNDTFIFHALLHGRVRPDHAELAGIDSHMADVEELNKMALAGRLAVSKISLGVVPHILDRYALLSSGAALGWGCGPLVVARKDASEKQLMNGSVAIPGSSTTARLLLDLHGGFNGPRKEMLFSDIMPSVAAGKVDLGVIIHEGRFTYGQYNLRKIMDLGNWWEQTRALPLPLGAIAVRRDVPGEVARSIEKAIAQSIGYARKHPEESRDFIRSHAQELDENVTKAHIDTFVTDYSLDLGDIGRNAIRSLIQSAFSLNGVEFDKNLFLD